MADPITPPVPVPPVPAAPPPPPPPSVPLPPPAPMRDPEAEELARLSPFEVMKRKEAAAPPPPLAPAAPAAPLPTPLPTPPAAAAPPPVPSSNPAPSAPAPIGSAPSLPSREELLRQAAQAPATEFILPNPAPDQSSFMAPPPPAPARMVSPAPVAAPVPPAPQPPRPQPSVPTPVPVPAKPQAAPQKGNMPLIITLGGLFGLAVLVGIGYALAYSGVQVPLLYTMVSNLEPGGTKVAQQALSAANTAGSYDIAGSFTLTRSAGGGASSAVLPSSSASGGATTTEKVLTYASQNVAAHVAGPTWVAQEQLSVNSTQSIPVTVQSKSGTWTAYMAANAVTKVVQTDPEEIRHTVLYPALAVPTVAEIVPLFASSTSYKKVSVNSSSAAHYEYAIDTAKLADLLPQGAVVTASKGTAEYLWKSRLPASAAVSATFTYQGDTYAWSANLTFSRWGAASSLAGDDISGIANASSPNKVVAVTFAKQLGIMPGALATDIAIASFTTITPSGETSGTVGTAVTTTPPVPAPATTAAQARDTQRLKDLTDLQTALEAYKVDTGMYPVTGTMQQVGASKTLFDALVPHYLTALPVDPLPNTYWYEYTSATGSSYLLRSVAEDAANSSAKQGVSYAYFERTSN